MDQRKVGAAGLFSSLQYYEAGKISNEAKEILNKCGAKRHSYLSELVKIAISDTTENEEEYGEISDIYDVPVVSCKWVILSQKCGKLLPTKAFPPKLTSSALFNGKTFCAARHDKEDLDALWTMITFNGGDAQRVLNSDVTHLICSTASGKKYSSSKDFTNVKVVSPDWVTDCVESQIIINEEKYHPQFLITTPALRKQLLSALPRAPIESKSGHSGILTPQKPKSVAKTFQPPVIHSTPSTAFTHGESPLVPGSSKSPAPLRARGPGNTKLLLHEMPSGFPGFQYEPRQQSPQHLQHGVRPGSQPHHIAHQPQMPSQFIDHGFMLRGGPYGAATAGHSISTAADQFPPPPMHHSTSRPPNRSFPVANPPPVHSLGETMGYAPIHYTGAAGAPARQSPVSPSMMGMRHAMPLNQQGIQRSSPVNRKTPPVMNFGSMAEVPYPSQASLPEETPIVRMTNMAAFPMGSEIVSSNQRKSPATISRSNPAKSQLQFTPMSSTGSSPAAAFQQQSKSPVNPQAAAPTNISVIKSVKSQISTSVGSTPAGSNIMTSSADRVPSTEVNLPPSVTSAKFSAVTDMAAGTADVLHVYHGYDTNEAVPTDMCLAGCIFYMGEYLKNDPCEQWIKAIEENGGTVDPSYSNRVTHVLVETQSSDVCRLALNDHKRVVTAHWLNDVIGRRRMEPPWRAHHLPHPHASDRQLCGDQVIGISGFDKEERRILYVLVRMLGASFTHYLASTNTALICKKLEGEKVRKAEEWGVECVNVQWLSELVLGNLRALKLPIDNKYKVFGKVDDFSIDQHMADVVMSGWRVPLKIPKDCCRKFKPSTKATDSAWETKRKAEGEMFMNPTKRMRLQEIQNTNSNLPVGQTPFILLTGFTKGEKLKYAMMITNLGGVVCGDVTRCTHLIADKVLRTPNFLMAVNYCSYISSSEWITESSKCGHFVDERVFTLQNSEVGSVWNILEALHRRTTLGRPFNGLTFHITPGVPLSTSLPRKFLCNLITAAGGVVQSSTDKRWPAQKILDTRKTSHNGKPTYIVVACRDDIHICLDLLHTNQDIYSVEFILTGVMNQQPSYESVLCITRDS